MEQSKGSDYSYGNLIFREDVFVAVAQQADCLSCSYGYMATGA